MGGHYYFLGGYEDTIWCGETKFGSGIARAIVSYIVGHCGGEVCTELDYRHLAEALEFTEEEIRDAVALLLSRGFARITRRFKWTNTDVLMLLTPGRLVEEAREAEAERKKAEARAAKIALRGGRVHRAAIAEQVKVAVFERDRHACRRCGATSDLTLDHVHPWSIGGPDTPDNLQVLCRPCNSRKGDRT